MLFTYFADEFLFELIGLQRYLGPFQGMVSIDIRITTQCKKHLADIRLPVIIRVAVNNVWSRIKRTQVIIKSSSVLLKILMEKEMIWELSPLELV